MTNILKNWQATEDAQRMQFRRRELIYKLSHADAAGSQQDATDEFIENVEGLIDRESTVLEVYLNANDDLAERRRMGEAWRAGLETAIEEIWDVIAQRRSGESSALPTGARAKCQELIMQAAGRLSRRNGNQVLI